jgi:hypothetical protein
MKHYILGFAALLGLAACKEATTHDKLIGKWQETEVINPQLDQAMKDQKEFADTIGNSTTPEQNLRNYGVANVDSLKRGLLASIDSFRLQRDEARRTTSYEFLQDGKMYIRTMGELDSASWSLDDDGALILDESKMKGDGGAKLRFEILALNDTVLKLQYNEKFLSSTTVFRPVKK